MKNIFIKIILLLAFISLLSIPSIAAPFNSSTGTAGAIGLGNGYFDNENSVFNISSDRNIYVVTEPTEINLVEPIGFPLGISNMYQLVYNSSTTLRSALVTSGGYLVFVDSAGVKAKLTRNSAAPVDAGGSSSTSDVLLISATANAYDVKEFEGNIYYLDNGDLKYFSLDDAIVHPVFSGITPVYAKSGFGIMRNSSSGSIQIITAGSSSASTPYDYYFFYSTASSQNNQFYTATGTAGFNVGYNHDNAGIFVTDNYLFIRHTGIHNTGGTYANDTEEVIFYTNLTLHTADPAGYTTGTALNRGDIIANTNIGTKTDVAMYSRYDTNQYDVFEFLEAGEFQGTTASGLVEYIEKTVIVSSDNFYNDSVIPINVDLKFIITNENITNYAGILTHNIRIRDPSGVEIKVQEIDYTCIQSQPWWDPFGVFTLFILDNVEPWACDGTQTVQYSRTPGTFWTNGTYEVDLTEDLPGVSAVLSTDSWNIINQSSGGSGTVSPPTGGGDNDIQGRTDDFLSSGMMIVFIMLIIFAAIGQIIGGIGGAVVGFGGGFLFCAAFGLIPMWALFLFAILVITAFAFMFSDKVTGGSG